MTLYDPYFSTKRSVARLFDQYKKYNNLIVGFDLDDTIYDFHGNGYRYNKVIKILQQCSQLNFTMILCTSKERGHSLIQARKICEELGINVTYINENPLMKTDKPFVNIYLDDKAGLKQAYEILKLTLTKIKRRK